MFTGIDFPDYFAKDRFSDRRSGLAFASGNPYDPESLITGKEAASGLTYDNSRRDWPSERSYENAVAATPFWTTERILEKAPRRKVG